MTAGENAPRRAEFLGLAFDTLTLEQVMERVATLARGERFSYAVTPNVDHVVQLHRHNPAGPEGRALWQAYDAAALRLCDSRILARLAGLSRLRLSVVPGSDLTVALLASDVIAGWRVALIGGNAAQLDWLRKQRPDCKWAQMMPPMGVRTSADAQQAIVDFIAHERADLTLFAIGAPQSELVAHRALRAGTCRGLALCIGASIEFLTGEKRRAPVIWQKLGMEWAFRLLSEPQRLWRRYLVEGPAIFRIWWRWQRQNRAKSC